MVNVLSTFPSYNAPFLQVFVKSQLANAAAEELRYQKSATEAFAKDFLMEVCLWAGRYLGMAQFFHGIFLRLVVPCNNDLYRRGVMVPGIADHIRVKLP